MVDAMLELMPTAEVWHLGLFRDERTLRPVEYYNKLPDSATVDLCLILDPMLATGGSATAAIEVLKRWGATRIKLINLIAAPEGVAAVSGGPSRRRDLLRRPRPPAQREGLHPARPRRRRRPPVRHGPLADGDRPAVDLVTLPKNHLMLIAGLVWCAAGAMVCVIGLPLELGLAPSQVILIPLAVAIFLLFYVFVFSPLVRKHTGRIRARTEDRLPFWNFFNASSWVVMAVMMGGGMALRLSHLMPDWAIAFFYSGLGVALFLCGVRFLGVFARKDVLAPATEPIRAD